MRINVVVVAAALVTSTAVSAQRQSEDATVTIGPWTIEAIMRGSKFDSCSMTRVTNDINATIVRTSDGLAMTLDSSKWKLERGKQYQVDLVAGATKWSTRASADRNAVTIALTDASLNEALREANALQVRGEGATIRVPLNKSLAALDRLEACYEKNSRSIETNPFVAPGRP
jgi:hypothetical protein